MLEVGERVLFSKEERHADVVDGELKMLRDALIGRVRDVCPQQCERCPDNQKSGVVEKGSEPAVNGTP
jgi:hypothetical protein